MENRALGVVLLAHGSRVPEANAGVVELAKALAGRLAGVPVQPCFLVRAQPDLKAGVAELVRTGARRVVILPFFLSNGLHVREDIPHLVEELKARYPAVEIICAPSLGLDGRLVEILAARLEEVLQRAVPPRAGGH